MPNSSEATILNVDDNEAGRYATSRILRQAGFEVKEAATGAEALRLAQENPDLIVLDVKLPDINGFEVCRQLRAIPLTATIPVLHLSATFVDTQSKVNGLESGADGYLTQPVEPPVLVAYVKALLRARQTEASLRESEATARALWESPVDSIVLMNPDGIILDTNQTFAQHIGRRHDELIGRSVYDFLPSELAKNRRGHLDELVHLGAPVRFEDERAGMQFDQSLYPIFDSKGKVAKIAIAARDITARKRGEEALRVAEANYRSIFENAVEGIYQSSPQGRFTSVNSAMARILGYASPEEFITGVRSIQDQFYVDLGSRTTALQRLEQKGTLENFVSECLRKDGSRIWISENARAVRDANGTILYYEGFIQDITERKRAEEETRERAQQLALLYDAGLALNGELDSRNQLEFIFKTATKAMHADYAEFSRYDPKENQIRFEIGVGYGDHLKPESREGLVFALEDPDAVICRVARSRKPLNIPDLSTEPHWIAPAPDLRSALWVPILREEELLGVLTLSSMRLNAFIAQDERLLLLFANQAAVAMENARLFGAEKSRASELALLYHLSRSLAEADDLNTILDLIVHRAAETLPVTFARIALLEGNDWVIRATHPLRVLDRDLQVGDREPLAAHAPCQHALEQNELIVVNLDDPQVTPQDREKLFLDTAKTLCVVPLCAGEYRLGLLMLGEARRTEREPFNEEKMRMARNIGDEAASALRRVSLREETEKQLQQVLALHAIDSAITSSTNLKVSLDIILSHVKEQLHMDAADVLLFDPLMGILQYAAGRGFNTSIIEESHLHLGEGMAGQAALERQTIHYQQLVKEGKMLKRSRLILKEGFVTYYGVPLIAQGKVKGVLEIFHRAPFEGNREWMHLLETLAAQTTIAIEKTELFEHLERSNTELALAYDSTIEGWSRAMDLRDKSTEGHTQRVTEITVPLARQLGISESELVHVRRGTLLHDIGKIGVPDQILHKPGPLTEGEWVIMRQHPVVAFDLLSPIPYLRPALDIPYCHHEKWDGTGYPRALKGEEIPFTARIFAVVDVWDALRSERPYREAWPETQVRAHLKEYSAKHFDPKVVEAFLNLLEILFPDSGSHTDPKSRTTGYPRHVFNI